MLRMKRITPIKRCEDGTTANPLYPLVDQFVQWTVGVGLSEHTAVTRRAALRHFLRWCDARHVHAPSAITRDLLEAYQIDLASYCKPDGQALERTTQISRLNPLKAFFKWMVRRRILEADPSRELELPKAPRRLPRRIPSVDEVRKIISGAGGSGPSAVRDRAMMEMLYSSGLRRMELARLRITDVSVDAGTIMVRAGKGGRDRVVPLGQHACEWVSRYERDVRPRLAGGLDRGELFLTDYGEPFRRNRLGDHLRRYVARQGLSGACHIFRHACATHMLENGADIRFIQALLGHASLTTTQVYTQVAIGRLKEVHAATHPARVRWD